MRGETRGETRGRQKREAKVEVFETVDPITEEVTEHVAVKKENAPKAVKAKAVKAKAVKVLTERKKRKERKPDVEIACIVCGAPRTVKAQDIHQVKRCKTCQAKHNRTKRKEARKNRITNLKALEQFVKQTFPSVLVEFNNRKSVN